MEDNLEITFKEEETKYLDPNHDNPLVVFVRMINARVKRVMIDTDSFPNILYLDTFHKLELSTNDLPDEHYQVAPWVARHLWGW